MPTPVLHRTVDVDGVRLFYREAARRTRRYEDLLDHWRNPTPEGLRKLAENVSEQGFRDEFADADRLGPARRLHARGLGSRLPA